MKMRNFSFLGQLGCGILLMFTTASRVRATSPDWKAYPYTPEGTSIEFPADEGSHPLTSALEWWYTVMHVKGLHSGDDYAILVTHFSNEFRFFTITNTTRKTHTSGTTRGRLEASLGYMDVRQKTEFGTDHFRTKRDAAGNLLPFEYEIETHHSEMHLKADLVSTKAPLLVGGDGFVPIGSSGSSWYYSLTRLEAKGHLTLQGFTEPFVGQAWIDHQWGPFLISPVEANRLFETYEWFCIQLDNGVELMISNIYDRLYRLPKENSAYGGVGIVFADGSVGGTLQREFKRTSYWQDPKSGHYMSMGWDLSVPQWQLNLKLTPKFKNQMVHFPLNGDFWEGAADVRGSLDGKEVTGLAFGELIHRFELPRLKILKNQISNLQELELSWRVENPDDGNPLHFALEIIGPQGGRVIQENLFRREIQVLLQPEEIREGGVNLRLHAYSVDETIHSSLDHRVPVKP